MRGREFLMKDLYSFNKDQQGLDEFYEQAKQAYFNVFKRLDIGDITYLTYAPGGSFSKYSHEFQTVCSAGEDIIYICNDCQVAINKEIVEEQSECPICGKKDLQEGKASEVGNIFKLKNKFSTPFNLNYTDENGETKDVYMGCFGIGISRLMGVLVEIFNDEKGIIWPQSIAPFQVHLIGIFNQDEEGEVKREALSIYQELKSKGIEVLFDDRKDVSAGKKFADADLIGCPTRVVISPKTLKQNKVEKKDRKEKEALFMDKEEFINDTIKNVK